MALATTLPRPTLATDVDCQEGLFGVAAQIVKIEPRNATLTLRATGGPRNNVGVDGLVCAGESFLLAPDGPVTKVELLIQGRKQTLVPPDTFVAPRGALAHLSQSLSYLSDLVSGSRSLQIPPDIPKPTAARGSGGAPASAGQIRAMRLLQDLPRQRLLATTTPVLSWRDGLGPYRCQSVSDEGATLSQSLVDVSASWCTLQRDATNADQLLVADSRGQSVAWNIRTVTLNDLPRPDWLPAQPLLPSVADQTAWAVWLWRDADRSWRLQALGMLNELAPTVWMAGYLRNRLLSEDDHFGH